MDAKFVFQGVHMLFSQKMLDGEFWQPNETRTCTFVFIGCDLDKDAPLQGFEQSIGVLVQGSYSTEYCRFSYCISYRYSCINVVYRS